MATAETFDTSRGDLVRSVDPQKKEAKVDTLSSSASKMRDYFQLVNDLREGTKKMREESSQYLPRFEGEDSVNYSARVKGSFLFRAYDKAVDQLSARPFNDRIRLKEGTPPEIVEFAKNVDGMGQSLTKFGNAALDNGIHHGITGILVDFPDTTDVATNREAAGMRPVWELIDFDRVLGVRVGIREGEILPTQVRIYTGTMMDSGDFGEIPLHLIRVYEHLEDGTVTFQMWQKVDKADEYKSREKIKITTDMIPFIPFYTNYRGPFMAEPALQALAEKNLEHFQSSSDQRNILHFVRAATLFRSGWPAADSKKKVPVGANAMHTTSNEKANMKYVEHTGKGVESGAADIQHIEEQMVLLGLEPLMKMGAGVEMTATEKALNSNEEVSQMRTWVRDLESSFDRALDLTANWLGLDYESHVDINDQFSVLQDGAIRNLLELRRDQGLSDKSTLQLLKRQGQLPEDFDVEAELVLLKEQRDNDISLLPQPQQEAPDRTNGPDIL